MSVRINLEIGHEAAIRTKRTQEGFTHDWEVFVRGCDGANIHYYVEKVVFYLHETFPKPKRVIKEPPYSLKESGYAGFTLPVEIHLRNKDEPKKISFNYDLYLQPSGPAIFKVLKEKYVFNLPGDDFKLKLLKGGGVMVNSLSSQEINRESRPASEEKSQLVSKPRLGGSDFIKKHKPKVEEPRISNSFQELFGPPITKTSKVSLEPKPVSKDKNSNISKSGDPDFIQKHKPKAEEPRIFNSFQELFGPPITKTSKVSHELEPISKDKNSNISKPGSSEKEKSKSKHSPHKDKEKEKFKDKGDFDKKSKDEKKREEKKDRSKDREERLKEKKERREKSPKVRSPTPTKRPSSPKRPPSPMPKYKDKEEKKPEIPKEKKSTDEKDKSEKKAKKEKRDKDKDRKESKHKDKDSQKVTEQKENKNTVREKEKHKESVRDKEPSPLPPKSEKKEKSVKEKEQMKDYVKETKEIEHVDKNGKIKNDKLDEKPKHKHKNKDKRDKEKSNTKEKAHKSEKKNDKSSISTNSKYIENIKDTQKENEKSNLFDSPKNTSVVETKINEKPKKPLKALLAEFGDSDTSNSSPSSHEDLFTEPATKVEPKKEPLFEPQPPKLEPEKPKVKKERTKKNKDKKAEKDAEKKRKRKADANRVEEPLEKIPKEESSNSNSKDSDTELNPPQMEAHAESEENYEDYMNILRDLQHKILTLQDNSELQRVVQLIAETGRFEVSAQTFDFDLCLLERSTITQLQNFFESTS